MAQSYKSKKITAASGQITEVAVSFDEPQFGSNVAGECANVFQAGSRFGVGLVAQRPGDVAETVVGIGVIWPGYNCHFTYASTRDQAGAYTIDNYEVPLVSNPRADLLLAVRKVPGGFACFEGNEQITDVLLDESFHGRVLHAFVAVQTDFYGEQVAVLHPFVATLTARVDGGTPVRWSNSAPFSGDWTASYLDTGDTGSCLSVRDAAMGVVAASVNYASGCGEQALREVGVLRVPSTPIPTPYVEPESGTWATRTTIPDDFPTIDLPPVEFPEA